MLSYRGLMLERYVKSLVGGADGDEATNVPGFHKNRGDTMMSAVNNTYEAHPFRAPFVRDTCEVSDVTFYLAEASGTN